MNFYAIVIGLCILATVGGQKPYYGRKIGEFRGEAGIKGIVYAASDRVLFIKGFNYDSALGGDSVFMAENSPQPDPGSGQILNDQSKRPFRLTRGYNNENLLLWMPGDQTFDGIRWISVASVSTPNSKKIVAQVNIANNFEYPKEHDLGPIITLAHGVKSDATIIKDQKTILIKNLYYDGAGPDAYFLVGRGDQPHANGIKVPDETGKVQVLKGYRGKDVLIRLPDSLTIFDVDWFSVFCIMFTANFGSHRITQNPRLNVPADLTLLQSSNVPDGQDHEVLPNCETIFQDLMQVSWKMDKDSIVIQLEGEIDKDNYLAFGLSGDPEEPQMKGSDVAIAFFRRDRVQVVDYYLSDYAQCVPQTKSGVCPDIKSGGSSNVEFIEGQYIDGRLRAVYRRKLLTADDTTDLPIMLGQRQSIVAAIGPINSKGEAAKHTVNVTRHSIRIRFDRRPKRNCNPLSGRAKSHVPPPAWEPAIIKDTQEFTAVIGQSGNERGYVAITGVKSWGISWWINDKLIPELHVDRGKTYTFKIFGGRNPEPQSKYHPFYLTDNPEGGGGQFPHTLNRPGHKIYAGVQFVKGQADPSPGAGEYCELKNKDLDQWMDVNSIEEYRSTLRLSCEKNMTEPAVIQWTPDAMTPNVIYYQCFTHRNLGWKILVHPMMPSAPAGDGHAHEASHKSGAIMITFQDLVLITGLVASVLNLIA